MLPSRQGCKLLVILHRMLTGCTVPSLPNGTRNLPITACCVPFFSGKNLTKTGKKQHGYPLLCRREKCFQNIMLFLNVFLLSKDSKNGIFISRTLHVFTLWKIVMLFRPLSLGEITSKHALLLSYKCGKNVPNELERPLGCFSCFFTWTKVFIYTKFFLRKVAVKATSLSVWKTWERLMNKICNILHVLMAVKYNWQTLPLSTAFSEEKPAEKDNISPSFIPCFSDRKTSPYTQCNQHHYILSTP